MATAVFFHAHPDDEAIATGGSMALARELGHRVVLVFATRGEVGEVPEGFLAPGESLGDRREVEARAAAEVLGAHRVEFLGYRDSGMIGEPTNDHPDCFWQADVDVAAEQLASLLRDEATEVLTVYDEHGGYGHPDHIQVHRVGVAAAQRAGVARVFQSTMNRDRVREGMERMRAEMPDAEGPSADEVDGLGLPATEITHCIDVRRFAGLKRRSMAVHASQMPADHFMLSIPDEQFNEFFGFEWYAAHDANVRGEPYAGDLFGEE